MDSTSCYDEEESERLCLKEKFTAEELDFLFSEIVQAIMIFDHNKKPFKRADLAANLNCALTKEDWSEVMIQVEKKLDVLGLELHETQNTKVKRYFVVNKVRPLQIMHQFASEEEVSDRILLFLVLAFIFIKNGTVNSDGIFKHLEELNIFKEDVQHPYFGDIREKITTQYTEQLYLSFKPIEGTDEFRVSWGQRAELELTKRSVLDFICQCPFKGTLKHEDLASLYEKVREQELVTFSVTNKSMQVDLPGPLFY